MTPGSKLHAVWSVVRDNGWVTPARVAAATGHREHQIAPLLWWLTSLGWAVHRSGWYASARTASWRTP